MNLILPEEYAPPSDRCKAKQVEGNHIKSRSICFQGEDSLNRLVHEVEGFLSCWFKRGVRAKVMSFSMAPTVFVSHLNLINIPG